MSSSTFWRTVISGLIATFVMSMISFLQGGLGLPTIDVGHILKENFNYIHPNNPYTIMWGNVAYFIVGVLLALFYVVELQKRLPKNWVISGVIYGIIISLIAGLIVAPLASLSAGDPFGVFYSDTWMPFRVFIAGLTMHIGYGFALLLCLKYAGVKAES